VSDTINVFMTYQFLRRLVMPFNRWPAFKLGIIDASGNVLIPSNKFTEPSQYRAWSKFDVMVRNLKRLLAKVPGGQSTIGSYAAAFLLLKEGQNRLLATSDIDLGMRLAELINESEVPANVAGGVAGAEAVARRTFLRRKTKKTDNVPTRQ